MRSFVLSPVFSSFDGGMIFGGIDQSRGVLYQVLRIADSEADVIVAVDLNTNKAKFSRMTNLRHVHNLNLVPTL
ncbi:hypothetical protein KUTeg_006969 [Tegillarca granosa]|uniref:Uncharacterized protein n=1 Tax=Tegillarca granosa TaxID=220873 RepID=A0ABQ9FBV9_TEGGR|nr:hypothetical protein KUTeg_006969 [Tegillarca granosa]